ncbi:hypothetical protein SAMN05444279_12636 [Ruegeria intermedia]|uniref:Uncharacterized protein n=1 Tax=Ruegeria intermedia TaxID=996115 RepID=A0A1M5AJQ2_9RHOB|nr:hypothetical protein [Ruegeria intermedia]SHF30385.1 hypothetical protein SAMN05444279_12636 [Ruegeria intermedia]
MSQETEIQTLIAQTIALLRKKLGTRGKTLAESVRRAKRRLPRHVYKQAMELARAEPMAAHPRLRLILDTPRLEKAAHEVQAHLRSISLADRRWGWFLDTLGALAFNLLALAVLVLIFLLWRGLI